MIAFQGGGGGDSYGLIGTSTRGLITVGTRVDEQCLVLAHEPSREVLALDFRNTPCEGVSLEHERAKRVFGRIERRGERSRGVSQVGRLLHVEVERRAARARVGY